ncbi:hypothetical protein DACRYDRAFT_106347 [Dacryopinax primogenitus]|uniref:Uncharacterized protein n=1 Tax=Dacryopinax primogenitus (strain DJM 731) TaxID=1858805 RepID=M5G4L9_DACPD|nr:uncharacterized protein DACRYDRAFT_106347 [Dacryopinax primogenitus]EJU03175.1 hypothetical protein DACRYDRAFT_106347 [Dacryopinax primogenitus]
MVKAKAERWQHHQLAEALALKKVIITRQEQLKEEMTQLGHEIPPAKDLKDLWNELFSSEREGVRSQMSLPAEEPRSGQEEPELEPEPELQEEEEEEEEEEEKEEEEKEEEEKEEEEEQEEQEDWE